MPTKVKAPVDTPGKWVPRREFPGTKSFGFYRCECNKQWISAHAFKDYRQDCKGCKSSQRPKLMWVNDHKKKDEDQEVARDSGKPHEKGLCEACRRGICSAF